MQQQAKKLIAAPRKVLKRNWQKKRPMRRGAIARVWRNKKMAVFLDD